MRSENHFFGFHSGDENFRRLKRIKKQKKQKQKYTRTRTKNYHNRVRVCTHTHTHARTHTRSPESFAPRKISEINAAINKILAPVLRRSCGLSIIRNKKQTKKLNSIKFFWPFLHINPFKKRVSTIEHYFLSLTKRRSGLYRKKFKNIVAAATIQKTVKKFQNAYIHDGKFATV